MYGRDSLRSREVCVWTLTDVGVARQYLRMILGSRVYDVAKETALTEAVNLGHRLECRVLLKREDTQPVFSFKLRGAYNKMAHLDPATSWRGVICCSAGNHAQGVAYSARRLRIPATIVMPKGTPSIKYKNVARLGGNVVLHGDDFDAAKEECARLEKAHGLINIPPFDDPYVIAGQGTIGLELVRQTNIAAVEAVFCCVGGGGLIAGVGVALKRIAPHVRIIGVETVDANAMALSLKKGERVVLKHVGLFADGAAVKTVGEETFRLCREVVDEIIQVTTDEACAAMKDFYDDTRSVLEPAGALSIAGLKKYVAANPSSNPKRTLVAITSGANTDFDRLRFVSQRATLGEGKEALLAARIPETPGSFARLIAAVMPHAVTEFSYRYQSPKAAHVLLGLSLTGGPATLSSSNSSASDPRAYREAELQRILRRIRAEPGMDARDRSDDELAKRHFRHLVGGRAAVPDERLYAFAFPERPGALERFLDKLKVKYNITLFQYRNEGGDIGHVMTGIQCPAAEVSLLESYLRDIGYPFEDATDSDLFRDFLRADDDCGVHEKQQGTDGVAEQA